MGSGYVWDQAAGPGQWRGACGSGGSAGLWPVTAWMDEMGSGGVACAAFSRKETSLHVIGSGGKPPHALTKER